MKVSAYMLENYFRNACYASSWLFMVKYPMMHEMPPALPLKKRKGKGNRFPNFECNVCSSLELFRACPATLPHAEPSFSARSESPPRPRAKTIPINRCKLKSRHGRHGLSGIWSFSDACLALPSAGFVLF